MQLVGAHESNQHVTQTSLSKDGSYSFENVLPGQYRLTATHSEWQITPSTLDATVAEGAAVVGSSFQVAGYRVSGNVNSKAGPVSGVHVLLFSAETVQVGCDQPMQLDTTELSQAYGQLLCSTATDAAGQYQFQGVPCGKYTLVPLYLHGDASFEIQPTHHVISVSQGNTKVDKHFTVTGFSVSGYVRNSAGAGVPDVVIEVNSKQVAKTDASGLYLLTKMQEGAHDVTASKQHLQFTPLKAVAFSPGKTLPDIVVSKLAVCGDIAYTDAKFNNNRRVVLASTDGSITDKTTHNSAGQFCFHVPAGTYSISPMVSSDEKAQGLVFSTMVREVTVTTDPVLDVTFMQGELQLTGSLTCLALPCDESITLRLINAASKQVVVQGPVSRFQPQPTSTGLDFTFSKLAPGKYELEAVKSGWCWQRNNVPVALDTSNARVEPLAQSGVLVKVIMSHSADLELTTPQGQVSQRLLGPGSHNLCLEGPGRFRLAPLPACFRFSPEATHVDVAGAGIPEPVKFSATHVNARGRVQVEPGLSLSDITLYMTSGLGEVLPSINAAPLSADSFEYWYALPLGGSVVVEPAHNGALFYPRKRIVQHSTPSECLAEVAGFEARAGLTITGYTQPAVPGAEVTVRFQTASQAGEVGGPGETAATTRTDAGGSFRVGPLYHDALYSVEVARPGYEFDRISGGPSDYVFSAKKLSQVYVTCHLPGGSAADHSAVLLSMSGDSGFKINTKLGSDGTYSFSDVAPGEYYLRPYLKEYQFQPPVSSVTVGGSDDHEVAFTAVKVAFSVTGQVMAVSGQPLEGVAVEVVDSEGVVVEGCESDEAGWYRIRGLRPGAQYTVQVRQGDSVAQAIPPSMQITMGEQDQQVPSFAVMKYNPVRFAITAAVKVPDAYVNDVSIDLVNSAGSIVYSKPLTPLKWIEVYPVKPGTYTLRATCTSSNRTVTCDGFETTVQVTSSDVFLGELKVVVAPRPAASEDAVSAQNALLLGGLIVALLVWRRDIVAEVLQVGAAGPKPGVMPGDAPPGDASDWVGAAGAAPRKKATTRLKRA